LIVTRCEDMLEVSELFSMTLIAKFSILVYKTRATMLKFMFSKKATKIDEIFTVDLTLTTSTVKISSVFVAFLENTNFIRDKRRRHIFRSPVAVKEK
jgi:hypothetical protein